MEVSAGYKQTDVGVMPEEWEPIATAEIVDPHAPICYGVVQVGQDTNGGVPIVAIKNVKEIASAPLHRTALALEQPYTRSRVRGDDVLISIKGTIGRVGVVPTGFEGNISRELARLRPRAGYSAEYIAQQLESDATQARISRAVVGTTRLEFSIATLRKFEIPVPKSLTEQRAIAVALSDVDALLGGLDRLIAKKRDLKQAAMQQLLTGQTRLPGFHGEWEVKLFGSLVERTFPKSTLSSGDGLESGSFPLFVSGGEPKRTEIAQFQDAEALVFSDGGVFGVRRAVGRFSVTDHCFVVALRKEIADMHWFEAWFSFHSQQMDRLTFKGSGLRNLDKPSLRDIEITTPDIGEQSAIAAVLSDMDAELSALEARRDKTRDLKQAMMQELLTGKTRLVPAGGVHA